VIAPGRTRGVSLCRLGRTGTPALLRLGQPTNGRGEVCTRAFSFRAWDRQLLLEQTCRSGFLTAAAPGAPRVTTLSAVMVALGRCSPFGDGDTAL
jgi:hypothetical protein